MELGTILIIDPASSADASQSLGGGTFGSGNRGEESGGTYGSGGRSTGGFTIGSGN